MATRLPVKTLEERVDEIAAEVRHRGPLVRQRNRRLTRRYDRMRKWR